MIDFFKMHGLGNDFMVVDATKKPLELTTLQIQELANRRLGIGFDQLLIIKPASSSDADFFCQVFNADGSEAEQCGNGMRCVGRLIVEQGLHVGDGPIRLQTLGGEVALYPLGRGEQVRVNMGVPTFAPKTIPLRHAQELVTYPHQVGGRSVEFSVVNVGNPHAVIRVDDISQREVCELGSALGSDGIFPEGVNVGLFKLVNPQHILLHVYERGAGETMACGSGACAAVVAGRRQGLLEERVTVDQPGGQLIIDWQGPGQPVWMTGPAAAVYRGTLCA